ncbi:MAG: 50S ribosomal protein L31 [Bacteroidetes bacterium RIFCSPLOWO2_02_FULL_36_8]|nr:MAG: 50S ribosomal protein L31 [Bacteroidetes bacterium RIFCSPLOWO2_02_FULL_36_8]OFY71113.1 MAG: 50S ribosomal protein L31 [Bacteroidetes bacterium RIFCSPLOWO2_12_FULL_37_12]
MKKGIHPEYHPIVFEDLSSNYKFLSRSTMTSQDTIVWEDGNTYPLIKVEISSKSHPFYTGKKMLVDTAGRVDKFKKRYAKKAAVKETVEVKESEPEVVASTQ